MARREVRNRSNRRERTRESRNSGRERGRKFQYRERDTDSTRKRAEQRGRDYVSIVKENVKVFRPKEGNHKIRILPPTWEDAEHFGFDVWVCYGIGPDDATVLSLEKMLNEDDPIAEEARRAKKDGDDEYAKSLTAKRRVGYWIIDRGAESEGPQFWSAPWTFDRDVCVQAMDDDSGAVVPLDHPEEGYDVSFEIQGKGIGTKYIGVRIARRSSSLGRKGDDWLEYIQKTPVPDALNYLPYEEIESMFNASDSSDKRDRDVDSDDDEDKPSKRKGIDKDWTIDDMEEGDTVMVIVDGEEIEGECVEVKRKSFVLEVDGDEEIIKFADVDEAEKL